MLLGGRMRAAVVSGQQQQQQRQQSGTRPAASRAPAAPALGRIHRKQQAHHLRRTSMAARAVAAAQGSSLRCVDASAMSEAELMQVLARPRIDFTSILSTVEPIVARVRAEGDAAVRDFGVRFDRVDPASPLGSGSEPACVPTASLPVPRLADHVRAAFDVAYDNIRAFHEAQAPTPQQERVVETMPGVRCRRVSRPIGSVGIYVPGGTAVLPSSALMLAVPAQIAGCRTVVLATPPRPDGSVAPEVLYCARKAGVTHVLRAGGAQAVAAMAYGTASTPKVDKILGPGNQYVTAAKMAVANSEAMVAIDMPAGPSEVLVIADAGAPASHVAADLLSQAEHGPDSQAVLLALPGVDVGAVQAEVDLQCAALPRGATARRALGNSCVVRVSGRDEAVRVSNAYAPEHLIVNVEDAEAWLPQLDNAGSVFLGRYTPESVGDYASGTNHVLPTYGYARMYSGVSLESYLKRMTVQELTREGLMALGPSVATMADVEGLDAHRRAVTLRMGTEQ